MNLKEIDPEMRIDQQEWLIMQVTLHIEKRMEDEQISKAELARRLGTNRAYITQLLDGQANMTLKKIADVMLALDSSLVVNTAPVGFQTTIPTQISKICRPQESSWEPMPCQEQTVDRDTISEQQQIVSAA